MSSKNLSRFLSLILILILPLLLFYSYFIYGSSIEILFCDYFRVWGYNGSALFDFYHSLKQNFFLPLWSASFSRPHFNLTSEVPELFQSLLYLLSHNLVSVIKFDVYIHLTVAGVGIYFLSLTLFKNHISAFFSAIVYMMTPFAIDYHQAALGRAWAMDLMPWGLLYVHKLIYLPFKLSTLCGAAFIIALSLLGHPENFFLCGLFYVFFCILICIFDVKLFFQKGLINLFFLVCLVILLTSFVYIPSILQPFPYIHAEPTQIEFWLHTSSRTINPEAKLQSEPFLSSFLLLDWELMLSTVLNKQIPWIILPWCLLFFGTLLTLLTDDTQYVRILGYLSVLGLWLSSGYLTSPVSLYAWFNTHLPFFNMSRHPDRYIFHTCISFALLAPLGFQKLIKRKSLQLAFLGTLLMILMSSSFMNSSSHSFTFYPFKKPDYVQKTTDWLEAHIKGDERIINGMGCTNILTAPYKTHAMADQLLVTYYDKDYFSDLMGLFGFKYIIMGKNTCNSNAGFNQFQFKPDLATTPQEEEMWTKSFSNLMDRKIIYDTIAKQTDWIPHPIEGTDVVIFENIKYAPDLYPSGKPYFSNPILVLGNYASYDFLNYPLDSSLPLSPVFIAQAKNLNHWAEIKKLSNTLLLHNLTFDDLALFLNSKKLNWVYPYLYRNPSWAIAFKDSPISKINPVLPIVDHGWLSNSYEGDLIHSSFAITNMSAQSRITFPLNLENLNEATRSGLIESPSSDLNVWLHIKSLKPHAWSLLWNNKSLSYPSAKPSFQWIKLPLLDSPVIRNPAQDLTIMTTEKEAIVLDAILIISDDEWKKRTHAAIEEFKNFKTIFMFQNKEWTKGEKGYSLEFKNVTPSSYILQIYSHTPRSVIPITVNEKSVLCRRKSRTIFSSPIFLDEKPYLISVSDLDFSWIALESGSSYERKSPFKFVTHTETHFPGWVLLSQDRSGHSEITPVITHLFTNGFILPSDTTDYKIIYRNNLHRTCALISLITWILICLGWILGKPWGWIWNKSE